MSDAKEYTGKFKKGYDPRRKLESGTAAAAVLKHGHRKNIASRTYKSWLAMKQRCLNPNRHNYYLYGGRGIVICESWLLFENFLKDMGVRPDGMTLDRIDVDGNYEAGNCKWSTAKEQAQNRRKRG